MSDPTVPALPEIGKVTVPAVFARNGAVYANSRDVAAYFEKRHGDVLRALDGLECSEEFTQRNFAFSTYEDPTGRALRCVDMTKDGFSFLVMGFTGKEAAKFKERYIQQFNAMEATLRSDPLAGFSIPRTLPDALRLAANLADEVEQQKRQIETLQPAARAYDRIGNADGLLNLTELAKALEMQRKKLVAWLRANEWMYRTKRGFLGYEKRCSAGHVTHKEQVIVVNGADKLVTQLFFTPKGVAKLATTIPDAIAHFQPSLFDSRRPQAPALAKTSRQ